MFDKSLYNDEFFKWHKTYAHDYSIMTGKRLFNFYKPKSVVDFGCGIGSYLQAALMCGVEKVKGYDIGGDFAKTYIAGNVIPFIEYTDITKPIKNGKYDITLCIETAEHIEPDGSLQLVSNIAEATAGFCVWTAAPEGQEGCGHINCRSKEYWVKLFKTKGMEEDNRIEKVRELLRGSPDYVIKNLMVFKPIDGIK